MADDFGENRVSFEISRDAQIQSKNWMTSTSYEMQVILEQVVPQVVDFFEYLLQKRLNAK